MKKERITLIIYILLILIGLIAMIPFSNGRNIIDIIFPALDRRTESNVFFVSNIVNIVLFLISTVCFLKLRDYLKKKKSKLRYILYVVIFLWLATNVKATIGSRLMSYGNGTKTIELIHDKSSLKYTVDSTGLLHAEGMLVFKNYSADTLSFSGILDKSNFGSLYDLKYPDIQIPISDGANSGNQISIPPLSTIQYPIDYNEKLVGGSRNGSNTVYGTINRITKFTVKSGNKSNILYDE